MSRHVIELDCELPVSAISLFPERLTVALTFRAATVCATLLRARTVTLERKGNCFPLKGQENRPLFPRGDPSPFRQAARRAPRAR